MSNKRVWTDGRHDRRRELAYQAEIARRHQLMRDHPEAPEARGLKGSSLLNSAPLNTVPLGAAPSARGDETLPRYRIRQLLGGIAMLQGRHVHVEQDGDSLILTLDPGATSAARDDLRDDIKRAIEEDSASEHVEVTATADGFSVWILPKNANRVVEIIKAVTKGGDDKDGED